MTTTVKPTRNPLVPTLVRVQDFHQDTPDTFTLTLDPPVDRKRTPFQPGQFNMLYVFGVGEAAISLCGDPADPRALRHTIRAVGTVTRALARLRPGGQVGLRGPFGSGWPLQEARGRDVVIVCGGIGLPPLRPVIYHLLRHRQDYGRLVLLYGARNPTEVLYPQELEAWRKRGDVQVLVTVDQADTTWTGQVGLVTTLLRQAQFDPTLAVSLTCGPEVMMRFVLRELEQRGVAADRLYVSMERNMQCAIGMCGHCQFGPQFLCLDGPVLRYDKIRTFFEVREA